MAITATVDGPVTGLSRALPKICLGGGLSEATARVRDDGLTFQLKRRVRKIPREGLSFHLDRYAGTLVFRRSASVRGIYSREEVEPVATRTCAMGDRTFEVTLSETPSGSSSSWTVEHVYDSSINQEIRVPGMDSIVASTGDAAFARACDLIDKSLRSRPDAEHERAFRQR